MCGWFSPASEAVRFGSGTGRDDPCPSRIADIYELDGDTRLELRIACPVDATHGAGTEQRQNPVNADLRTDHLFRANSQSRIPNP